jgi:hypothetical protein
MVMGSGDSGCPPKQFRSTWKCQGPQYAAHFIGSFFLSVCTCLTGAPVLQCIKPKRDAS